MCRKQSAAATPVASNAQRLIMENYAHHSKGPLVSFLRRHSVDSTAHGVTLCTNAPCGLPDYLYGFLGRLSLGHHILLHALLYAERASAVLSISCGHCLITACLLLAQKFVEDEHVDAGAWVECSGMSPKLLHAMEIAVLRALDYRLLTPSGEFEIRLKNYQQDPVVLMWHVASRIATQAPAPASLPGDTRQGNTNEGQGVVTNVLPTPPLTPDQQSDDLDRVHDHAVDEDGKLRISASCKRTLGSAMASEVDGGVDTFEREHEQGRNVQKRMRSA